MTDAGQFDPMVVRGDEGEVIRIFSLDTDKGDFGRILARGPFLETGNGLRDDRPLRDLMDGICLDKDFVDTSPGAGLGDPAGPGWQDNPFARRADQDGLRGLRDAILRESRPVFAIRSAAFGINRAGAKDDPIHLRLSPPLRLIGAVRLRPHVVAPADATPPPVTTPRPAPPPQQRQSGTTGRNVVLALVPGVLVAPLFPVTGEGAP